MAVTIIPDTKVTITVFSKVVLPPKNFTEKYNGRVDNIKTKIIAINDIKSSDSTIFYYKSKFV